MQVHGKKFNETKSFLYSCLPGPGPPPQKTTLFLAFSSEIFSVDTSICLNAPVHFYVINVGMLKRKSYALLFFTYQYIWRLLHVNTWGSTVFSVALQSSLL